MSNPQRRKKRQERLEAEAREAEAERWRYSQLTLDEKIDECETIYAIKLVLHEMLDNDEANARKTISDLEKRVYELEEQVRQLLKPRDNRLFDDHTPIGELEVSTRIMNALQNEGFETVGDIYNFPQNKMLLWPNFGRKSQRDLLEAIYANP